jgi:thiamine kinase
MNLRTALEKVSPLTGYNLVIQLIPEALTNKIYRISSKTLLKEWALRISQKNINLGIDHNREERILKLISNKEWAVTPEYYSHDICLTQWIDGSPFKPESDSQIHEIAKLIANIHSVPTETLNDIEPIKIDEQLLKLFNNLPTKPHLDFSDLLYKKIQKYQPPKSLKLCHFDIHPGNLLTANDKLKLLDWEYAAPGDPLIDIACAIEGLNLDNHKQNVLLTALDLTPETMRYPICLAQALSLLWYMNRFPASDFNDRLRQWIQTWK